MTSELATLVATHYQIGCRPADISCWGAGLGLSGARIWQVNSRQGKLALRQWPAEFQDRERLRWLQNVLRHAKQRGFACLAIPFDTRVHEPFFEVGGYLWELADWLPGEANFHNDPTPLRLCAAMQALARLHVATADFPGSTVGIPPTLLERIALSERWRSADRLNSLIAEINQCSDAKLATDARRFVRQFYQMLPWVSAELARYSNHKTAIIPCLRDVWHAHVLYVGDEVTGIIDYGAARFDSPAACTSRLLASLAGNDWTAWQAGLDAYQQIRELSFAERQVIRVLDLAATLFTGMNWLNWLYGERRTFSDAALVRERVGLAARRLESLVTGDHIWHHKSPMFDIEGS